MFGRRSGTVVYDDELGDRRPRWRLWVLGVLGALVVLGAGIGLGRATKADTASTGVSSSSATSSSTSTGTAITSASAGPTYTLNGVPLGYSHDQAGAVAAAAAFIEVLGGDLVAHPDQYRLAVQTMAAPSAAAALRAQAEQDLDAGERDRHIISTAARGGQVGVRSVPISWRVESYSAEQAVVDLFEVLLTADGTNPFEAFYTDEAVMVSWASGDWRLVSQRPTQLSVPVTRQQGTGPAVPPEVTEYQPFASAVAGKP